MNKTKKLAAKLSLKRETVRTLADDQLRNAAGGMPPLSFNMCPSDNCLTLGEFCNTHDCTLTFGPCGGWSITVCTFGK